MPPDLIIHHAKIYTVDSDRPWAEAVACAEGRIVAVGSNDKILALAGPQTRSLDMAGKLALPGLIDAHVHFLQYAIRRHHVNLFGITDFDEVQRRVRQGIAQVEPGQWVQGWGWDETIWNVQPEPDWLTKLAPHTPVVLARLDMHTWWVNQAAMQQAGISRDLADPPDSRVERDDAGNPTGLLREWNAIHLVEQHLPQPDDRLLTTWLEEAIAEAHRLGLTGIHDQRVEREGRRNFRLLQALERRGKLSLRVHMNLAADYIDEINTLGLQPGFGSDRLWLGHVKAFADGTLGSRTAYMLEPFEEEPNNLGISVTSIDRLAELAAQASQTGFSLSIHAIGDRAVREVIDVLGEFPPDLSEAASDSLPHRIEHVQVIHPQDLPRLKQHDLVASMQPVHLMIDHAAADRLWGRRARYTYAFRSLLAQGAQLALGSDAPVAPLNPMLGIQAALTRQDLQGEPAGGWYPEERITLDEAIAGYTSGPASLAGKAHCQGSITPGKWADMIVLSQNLFEIPPAEIGEVEVNLTIFGGQIVYEAR